MLLLSRRTLEEILYFTLKKLGILTKTPIMKPCKLLHLVKNTCRKWEWAASIKYTSKEIKPPEFIKVGYMEGASNGQKATFQTSFNTGYKQGLNFGLQLGFNEANISIQKQTIESNLRDPRRINCQICLNNTTMQESTVNLYNTQKEKNDEVISTLIHNT